MTFDYSIFNSKTMLEGRDLQKKKQVTILSKNEKMVQSKVDASLVRLRFDQDILESASCSCQSETFCKHMAATMLFLDEEKEEENTKIESASSKSLTSYIFHNLNEFQQVFNQIRSDALYDINKFIYQVNDTLKKNLIKEECIDKAEILSYGFFASCKLCSFNSGKKFVEVFIQTIRDLNITEKEYLFLFSQVIKEIKNPTIRYFIARCLKVGIYPSLINEQIHLLQDYSSDRTDLFRVLLTYSFEQLSEENLILIDEQLGLISTDIHKMIHYCIEKDFANCLVSILFNDLSVRLDNESVEQIKQYFIKRKDEEHLTDFYFYQFHEFPSLETYIQMVENCSKKSLEKYKTQIHAVLSKLNLEEVAELYHQKNLNQFDLSKVSAEDLLLFKEETILNNLDDVIFTIKQILRKEFKKNNLSQETLNGLHLLERYAPKELENYLQDSTVDNKLLNSYFRGEVLRLLISHHLLAKTNITLYED